MSAHMPLSHTNCVQWNLPPAIMHDSETMIAVYEIVDTLCRQSEEILYKNADNDKDYYGHNLFHTLRLALWIIFL